MRFIDQYYSIIKRILGKTTGQEFHLFLIKTVVIDVGIFGANHEIELYVDGALIIRGQYIIIRFLLYIDHPSTAIGFNQVYGQR